MALGIILAAIILIVGVYLLAKFDLDSSMVIMMILVAGVFFILPIGIFTPQKFEKQKYTKSDTTIEVVAIGSDLVFKNDDKYVNIINFKFDEVATGDKLLVRKIVRASDATFVSLRADATKYILIVPKDFATKLSN